jgi:hypothetical protein
MKAGYRSEVSLHGHSLDVLKSGLQKYIRRGNVDAAMYCLGELDCFSDCGREGERIRTNMIHRLMIIYMEDIGLGGVKSWDVVHRLVCGWLADRSREELIQALVCILCNAHKTRACSFARAYAAKEMKEEKAGVFANDIQAKNNVCIRTLLERVGQKTSIKEYKQISNEMTSGGVEQMNIAMAWIKEVKTAERPLFFLLPLLDSLFGGKSIKKPRHVIKDLKWAAHRAREEMVFDDFVFDKHTRSGNRDRGYFVNVSSQVSKEVFILPQCFRDAYHKAPDEEKEAEMSGEKETDFKLMVRCQLVCSRSKTDTVIALDPVGKLVFLKGPYPSLEPCELFVDYQEEKRKRGIPTVGGRVVWLIPNRWDETPLGIRNKLDCKKAWPFLVCDTVFAREDIHTIFRESKLWPKTEVLDATTMGLTMDPFKLTEQELDDYVQAVKFRVEFGIGDLADRNFIKGKDGRIYSIDEDIKSDVQMDLEKQLKKRRYELIKNRL